jgi:hypothetical protein
MRSSRIALDIRVDGLVCRPDFWSSKLVERLLASDVSNNLNTITHRLPIFGLREKILINSQMISDWSSPKGARHWLKRFADS